jgi:hypothetical protein
MNTVTVTWGFYKYRFENISPPSIQQQTTHRRLLGDTVDAIPAATAPPDVCAAPSLDIITAQHMQLKQHPARNF